MKFQLQLLKPPPQLLTLDPIPVDEAMLLYLSGKTMKPKLAPTVILVAASLAVVFTDPAADKGKEK